MICDIISTANKRKEKGKGGVCKGKHSGEKLTTV